MVLRSPILTSGAVERRLSGAFGYQHAVLFGNARSGMTAVLEEVASPGAPAVIPSNVCVAVLAAAIAARAAPRFAPVSPLSGIAEDARLVAAIEGAGGPAGVLMPTHLYGMFADYPNSRRLAADRGWFVLENDSLAATIADDGKPVPSGDALLVSLGPGKTMDAGGGGAVLTNDARLADVLGKRASGWPPFDATAGSLEDNLVRARRYLSAVGRLHLAEGLLDLDASLCRYSLPRELREKISFALDAFPGAKSRRMERLQHWNRTLRRFAPDIVPADIPIRSPWRAIFRASRPALRDRVAGALRSAGFDAGTNYPALTDSFPALLAGQGHPDADRWGATVLTLWLTADYDEVRIGSAARVIEKALADA